MEDYTVECKANIARSDKGVGMVIRHPCIDCDSGYWFGISMANQATIWYSNRARRELNAEEFGEPIPLTV